MPLNWPGSNVNNAAEYQVAGVPFVTASVANEVGTTTPIHVKLPQVSQWIVIVNPGDVRLRVGITNLGVQKKGGVLLSGSGGYTESPNYPSVGNTDSNYFTVKAADTSPVLHFRTKDLFFLADSGTSEFEIIAGLTTVDRNLMVNLTGSRGFTGVG